MKFTNDIEILHRSEYHLKIQTLMKTLNTVKETKSIDQALMAIVTKINGRFSI